MVNNKIRYFKPKAITLAKQAIAVKYTYPNFSIRITSSGELIIEGKIRPSPMSREYTIRINYIIGNKPIVEVVNPKLKDNGSKIPHTYSENRLCLYYPKYNEWTKHDYISDTIIPWSAAWLYYYEVWRITGEWLGGGKHPDTRIK